MEKPHNDKSTVLCSNKKITSFPRINANTPLQSDNSNIHYGGIDNDIHFSASAACTKASTFSYLRTLTIEPAFFCFLFGYFMEMACLSNMMMDKGCRYHFNYSVEICNNLSHYPNEKENVEILANNYSLYSDLMNIIGAISMTFIAPWSDKYGRKLPLIAAIFGITLGDLCVIKCILNFESELFYLLLARIPTEIFGGFICVMTTVFSHASEVSSEKTRTQKYTTVEIALGTGIAFGGLAGGTLFRYYGYFYVYLTATIIHIFGMMWVVFCVQETRGLNVTASWGEKAKDFFKFGSLTKGWKATLRQRENKGRTLILLLFLSICVVIVTYEAFGGIGFIYVHHIYNWDPMIYNSVAFIFSLSQMVILLFCNIVLIRKFKVSDYALGITGTISLIAKFISIAFANCGVYMFYFGCAVGTFNGLTTLAVRSGISKIVDRDELGKVFSFLSTIESILPMMVSIPITKVFNATINITPSVTYLMIAVLLFIPLGTFVWAHKVSRNLYQEI